MPSLHPDDKRQYPPLAKNSEKSKTFLGDLMLLGNDWWGEILSSLCSFICAAVLVFVLQEFDQKKLSQWPFDFSLNATVSLLATLAKLALMVPVTECISQLKWLWFTKCANAVLDLETYDGASRGATGCVKFLVKLPRPKWATVGIITSLLAIFASPLTQQAVEYPLRADCTQTAVADRIINYTSYSEQKILGIDTVLMTYPTLDMKGALSTGIFALSPYSIPPVAPKCATGNCTWAPFRSLAVCSRTINLSHLLNTSLPTNNEITCNSSLPSSLLLTASNESVNPMPFVMNDSSYTTGDGIRSVDSSLNYTSGQNPSSNSAFLNITMVGDLSNGNCTNLIAIQSLLYYCVKEFTPEVTNGLSTTTEKIVESVTTRTYIDSPTNDAYQLHVSVVKTTNGQEFSGVHFYFPGVFSGVYGDFQYSDPFFRIWTAVFNTTLMENGNFSRLKTRISASDDAAIQSVMDIMENIAASMTNTIRLSGSSKEQAIGLACTNVAFIQIRWPYLTLLLAICTSSWLLLISTMIQTFRLRLRGWKSSCLPMLSHCLEDNGDDELKGGNCELRVGNEIEAVAKKAKEVRLRFLKDGDIQQRQIGYREGFF